MRFETLPIKSLATTLALLVAPTGGRADQPVPAQTGGTQLVRAAGMPLNDGALAPGTLTVRVVQGAFTGNLSGLEVIVTIEKQAPKAARTRSDGRATFAHLPIGARVRASTIVGEERLESETFAMPPESGVRLLLVTREEFVDTTTVSETQVLPAGISPQGGASPVAAAGRRDSGAPALGPSTGGDTSVAAYRAFMITITAVAFGLAVWRQWTSRMR